MAYVAPPSPLPEPRPSTPRAPDPRRDEWERQVMEAIMLGNVTFTLYQTPPTTTPIRVEALIFPEAQP